MTPSSEDIDPVQTSSPGQFSEVSTASPIRAGGSSQTSRTDSRAQLNRTILQASIDVSISSGNDSLRLLLQSAIGGINDLLEPEFGKNAIQNAVAQDNTPAGTAGRIVALSTGFYEAFKQQHVGEPEAAVLDKFMATLRRGFEQGYKEARDILQGMKVLSGDIASNIDKTHELVVQGYADFAAAHSTSPAITESTSKS